MICNASADKKMITIASKPALCQLNRLTLSPGTTDGAHYDA